MTNTTNAPRPTPELARTIGLGGAIAFVVGGVVGAGIYALIGPIGAQAGTAIWLAFAIAIVVSLLGAIPLIQLASALPRAGAGYLYASRLLLPVMGTITSAWVILGGACSTCVVSLALVSYLPLPETLAAYPHLAAIAVIAMFYTILLLGVRFAMGLQVVMAAQMLAALLVYIIAGVAQVDLAFSVVPRGGASGFLLAVILCYNTCLGFQVLAEMGEEIRDARRTIPLALFIGSGLVAVIYILVGMVFVNSLPFDTAAYDSINAPLSASGALLLPPALFAFVNFGAITAGLTSLNAAAIAIPRELYAQARDGVLPARVARIAPHAKAPLVALTVFVVLVVVLMLTQRDLDFYGYMAAVGIQIMTSALCFACLRLRTKFPDAYSSAYIRFPTWVLLLCTGVTVIASIGFVSLIAIERPSVALAYLVLTIAAWTYHKFRRGVLARSGNDLERNARAMSEGDRP